LSQRLSNWASIAEIVSGVAVVVSLVVLIVEIRGNTDEVRAAALTNISGRTQELILANMSDPALRAARLKERQGQELSPSDELLLDQALSLQMKYTEESFLAFRDGRLDEEIWQTRANQIVDSLGNENDRRRWDRRKDRGWYVDDFVQWVNSEITTRYGE
jgi:hypothetical protein